MQYFGKKSNRTWELVSLGKSTKSEKKMMAVFRNTSTGRTKTTHFGQAGASDYTIHKDRERMLRYDNRHRARENWNDPTTAGALSKWILWNKPSKRASVADYKLKFF
jgi:hypothetical protein